MTDKEKQSLRDQLRAIINDYSEFISVKAKEFTTSDPRSPDSVPLHERMEKMHNWTEEFLDMAVEMFGDEN